MKKLLTLLAVLCGAVGGWHARAAVGDEFRGVPVYPSDASDQLWYSVLSEPDENENTGTVCVIQYPTGDNSSNYLGSSYEIPEMVERADGTSETVYVVVEISDAAFGNCTSLESITLPNTVTSIGRRAFFDCTSLLNIVIPNGVTVIDYATFYNCKSLESVVIPNTVTTIIDSAFRGCANLKNITFPDSVTSIGGYAFFGCTSLESVVLPSRLTGINPFVFYGCTNLATVDISDEVTIIGTHAFYACTSLVSVVVPSSVTEIQDFAFGRSGLTTVTIIKDDDESPTMSDDSFPAVATISYVYKLATPVITVNENTQIVSWTAGSSRADAYEITFYSEDGTQQTNPTKIQSRSVDYASALSLLGFGKYYCTVRAFDDIKFIGEEFEPSDYAQSAVFIYSAISFDANGVAKLSVDSREAADAKVAELNAQARTIDVPQSDGEAIAVPLKVGLIVGGTALEPTYTAHLQFATDMSAEQRAAVTPQVTDFRVTAEGAQVVVGESVAGLWYGSAAGATVAAVQSAGVANVAAPFVAGTGGELSFETRPTTDTQRFFKILVSPYNPGYKD